MIRLASLAAALVATPATAATEVVLSSGSYEAGQHISVYSEQARYQSVGNFLFRLTFEGAYPRIGFMDDPVVISGLGATQTRLTGRPWELMATADNVTECCGFHVNFQAYDGLGAGSWKLTATRRDEPAASATRLSAGSLAAGAVPEPATWAMLLLGFGAIGWTIRDNRRRRNGAFYSLQMRRP